MARQSVVAELRDAYYSELDAGEQSALSACGGGSVFAALPVLKKVTRRLRERGKETESQPAAA